MEGSPGTSLGILTPVRVLVFGAPGMIGHRLVRRLAADHEVVATSRRPVSVPGAARVIDGVDVRRFQAVEGVVQEVAPDVVVNCVAIIKQRMPDAEPLDVVEVNAAFPHRLASACAGRGARLIHLSTDCVFSGARGSYREEDPPDPVDAYGWSKALGEVHSAVTLRTSAIGWELEHRVGLAEWLRANRAGSLPGYRGAIFSGLATPSLADAVARVVDTPGPAGLFHVAATAISKHDLLSLLVEKLGWETEIVPVDEPRIDRSLDGDHFERTFSWSAPSWDQMATELAAELPRYEEVPTG